MDSHSLVEALSLAELTLEATALIAWDMGAVSSADEVAQFMYRGGPFPPQASVGRPSSGDQRPDKKYWEFVKIEVRTFLCTDDRRYHELWKRIEGLEQRSTTALVGVIATFLGESIGAPATLLAGFVAVCLYAVAKVGKEAYCNYSSSEET